MYYLAEVAVAKGIVIMPGGIAEYLAVFILPHPSQVFNTGLVVGSN